MRLENTDSVGSIQSRMYVWLSEDFKQLHWSSQVPDPERSCVAFGRMSIRDSHVQIHKADPHKKALSSVTIVDDDGCRLTLYAKTDDIETLYKVLSYLSQTTPVRKSSWSASTRSTLRRFSSRASSQIQHRISPSRPFTRGSFVEEACVKQNLNSPSAPFTRGSIIEVSY